MEESTLDENSAYILHQLKNFLCRYYLLGTCNYGEKCIYSHNENNALPIPNDVCLYFLRSMCVYGDECRLRHKTIEEIYQESSENLASLPEESELNLNQLFDPNSSTASSFTPINFPSKSYASAVSDTLNDSDRDISKIPLCSYYKSNGFCCYLNCTSIHGNYCDLCGYYALHPHNKQQCDLHRAECVKEHEESMELAFAYQRSKELTCAICLDVILDKEPRSKRRFGILENCNHIYCIECIRTWRNSKVTNVKNNRTCPQCRKQSYFIIPSSYFYEDSEQKQKLINDYKKALALKHCKHFKKGKGNCPFGGACFYKHEYPDGTKAILPMPNRRRVVNQIDIDLSLLDEIFSNQEPDADSFLIVSDMDYDSYENYFDSDSESD